MIFVVDADMSQHTLQPQLIATTCFRNSRVVENTPFSVPRFHHKGKKEAVTSTELAGGNVLLQKPPRHGKHAFVRAVQARRSTKLRSHAREAHLQQ